MVQHESTENTAEVDKKVLKHLVCMKAEPFRFWQSFSPVKKYSKERNDIGLYSIERGKKKANSKLGAFQSCPAIWLEQGPEQLPDICLKTSSN